MIVSVTAAAGSDAAPLSEDARFGPVFPVTGVRETLDLIKLIRITSHPFRPVISNNVPERIDSSQNEQMQRVSCEIIVVGERF